MFSILSLSLPHGSLYAEGTIQQMWCISAVLLWSFSWLFIIASHSPADLGWSPPPVLLHALISPPLVPFTHKHTPCQLASWKISTHPSYIFPLNLQNIFILERVCQREVGAGGMITEKVTFSQLLGVQFGCRLLVCVQWFMFCLSDHFMITFFSLSMLSRKHCFGTVLLYIIEDHFTISMATTPSVQR